VDHILLDFHLREGTVASPTLGCRAGKFQAAPDAAAYKTSLVEDVNSPLPSAFFVFMENIKASIPIDLP
jgi:hypothetical protein